MKSWVILIVLAVGLTAAATFALPFLATGSKSELAFPAPLKPEGPTPVVAVVEDLVYDFGKLPQQYTGHHTWTFKNEGLGVLELRGVSSTCSCTTADLLTEKKEAKELFLKPGESHAIDVSFQTKTWDHFHQTVTIATNDPTKPTVVLTINGEPKPALSTYPLDPSIGFGVIGNDQQVTRKLALFSGDRPDLKILSATSTNPAMIEVKTRPLTPEEARFAKLESGYNVDVTLKPTGILGAFAEEVVIETDHPVKPKLAFKVGGKVTGPITIVPERVSIRGATSSDGGTERLKVVARNLPAVKFSVEQKPDPIEVTFEPIAQPEGSKGSLYWMIVKVIPGTVSGRVTGDILMKTDDPLASEVKVPVDVIVQGAR